MNMAVPGDSLLSGNSGAAPDRGIWVGEPGPPWAPEDDGPLRVLLHGGMSARAEFEAYAMEIATSMKRDVEWLVTIEHDEETGGVGESLRNLADVRLLPPGPRHRMFWKFYRALRDFRPHVVHCCTRLGRVWAKLTGQRWIYSNIAEQDVEDAGVTSCVPGVASDDDLDQAYDALLAQPVDIMLVTMNQADVMQECLAHITANTWWPHRLIIVDNGSKDDGESLRVLRAYRELYGEDKCVLFESDFNLGCPGGRNLAYRECTNPFIAVLDNDMLVQPGWLNRLMETMDEQPNAGMVAPWCEVYPQHMRNQAPSAMAAQASNNLYRAEAVAAAAETPGVFYEEPFASCQGRSDTDLNFRIKEAGWDLWFDGRVSLHHLGGSLSGMAGLTRRHGDGAAMKQGEWHLQNKWAKPGIRRVTDGEGGA